MKFTRIDPRSIWLLLASVMLCVALPGGSSAFAAFACPQSDGDAADVADTKSAAESDQSDASDALWQKVSPKGCNAELMMPGEPKVRVNRFRPVFDEPFINVKTCVVPYDGGQTVFVFSWHDLHAEPTSKKQQREVLDGAVRGTVGLVVGVKESDESMTLRKYPGRKFTYSFLLKEQQLKSDAEVILIGRRQYLLATIFKEQKYDPELSEKYFQSFNPFDPDQATEPTSDEEPAAGGNDNQPSLTLPGEKLPVELK